MKCMYVVDPPQQPEGLLKHSFVDELKELLNVAGIEFDEKYLLWRLAPRRGAVMTNDFFRWSPRTPTTGYFLATLRVALG